MTTAHITFNNRIDGADSDDGELGGDAFESCMSLDEEMRRNAVALLSQQCWCWGKDVMRPEGNWLVQLGFERHPPPPEMSSCSSVYLLRLPEGRRVILRGFGVFFGSDDVGGVYLPRFEFTPRFCEDASLQSPPWDETELALIRKPTSRQRGRCLTLLVGLIDWICQYESNIADQLGVAYRARTLTKWQSGDRLTIPADEIPTAWRNLARQLTNTPDALSSIEPS